MSQASPAGLGLWSTPAEQGVPRPLGHGWLFFWVLLLGILNGCGETNRNQDMALFFQKHSQALSQLQTHLHQLKNTTGIRGFNREEESVYILNQIKTLSLERALSEFPLAEAVIQQAYNIEKNLELRNAYLLEDDSFWVILEEADILGADFGFLHEGNKPISSYRILNRFYPIPAHPGWYRIQF